MISFKIYEVVVNVGYPNTQLDEIDSILLEGDILIANSFKTESDAEDYIQYLAKGAYTILKVYE